MKSSLLPEYGFYCKYFIALCVGICTMAGTQDLYSQEDIDEESLTIQKAEIPKYTDKVPFHLDTTRMLSFGWYYIQLGAVANSIPRAIFLTTDSYWRDNWTGRRDFTMSVIGFTYPFATALVYNRIFRNTPVTPADANMFTINSFTGILHGSYVSDLVFEPQPILTHISGNNFILAGVSLAEGWASLWVSRSRQFTYTRSMAWNTGNFWGAYLGQRIGNLTSKEPYYDDISKRGAVGGLIGSGAGIFLTHLLHKNYPRTAGDYRAINSAMVGIALYGDGIFRRPNIFQAPNNNHRETKIRQAAVKGFQLSAMAAAYYVTRQTKLTSSEGFIISGFALSGTLIGSLRYRDIDGIRNRPNEPSPELAAGVGTIIGWCVGYGIVKVMRQPRYIRKTGTSWIPDFSVQPSGLAFMRLSQDQQASLLQRNLQQPLLQMSWRF